MTHYDYKVIPAPKRAKRVKGVRSEDLFALTLTETINEVARQGWEYCRAEHIPAEAPGGWFRAPTAGEQTLLVFRRPRESLGPRLAAVRPDPAEADPQEPDSPVPSQERAVVDRLQHSFRRGQPPVRLEPRLGEPGEVVATPLRPSPRLGPAEKP